MLVFEFDGGRKYMKAYPGAAPPAVCLKSQQRARGDTDQDGAPPQHHRHRE